MAAPARKIAFEHAEIQKVKNQIDTMLSHMQRKSNYTPDRTDLDYCAQEIINFLNKYKKKVSPHEKFLKTALIDLTEVPVMSAQMQRISFKTALKEASRNLDKFLSAHY